WRSRDPRAGRYRRDARAERHGKDPAPGPLSLLGRCPLPPPPPQQKPTHLLGSGSRRGSARLGAGAGREGQAPGDDRARRLSGRGGGSRRREDRLGASGDEEAGARYVGGRAAADRSSRVAAGADSEPRGRRITPEAVERPMRSALLGPVSSGPPAGPTPPGRTEMPAAPPGPRYASA